MNRSQDADNASAIGPPSKTSVHVIAPSRLHFGLIRFGDGHERQYGGAGVMIDAPQTEVRVALCDKPMDQEVLGQRVRKIVQRWLMWRRHESLCCDISILHRPAPHVGLGSGTQLALAITTALDQLHGYETGGPEQLARMTGRAERSAVGTYGFWHGGFIAELGKTPGETIGALHCRYEMPSGWRALLVRPRTATGLAGPAESSAFANLPPVPSGVAERLEHLLLEEMIPALTRGDFGSFAASVGAYGDLAGSCFAEYQVGSFANTVVAEIVETCRTMGLVGAGQSSWGPTVYCLTETPACAESARLELLKRMGDGMATQIAGFDNQGVAIA